MKESINEHDMTKKMMQVMRGGYKPLLTELENTPDSNVEQQPEEITQQSQATDMAPKPREGRDSLIPLDSSYFELDKDDDRFKALSAELTGIIQQATITSVYINKYKGLVINGIALDHSKDSGLFFTMSKSDSNVKISSENVPSDASSEVEKALNNYLNKLINVTNDTNQYLYDERIDKGKGEN